MYYKLPVKERIELMKSYRKANPNMSYHDMVKDYNDSYEKFGNGGKVEFNSGGETHVVYKKGSPTGNGKGIKGHIMVNHPTKDKGKWDTIDLTAITNYKVKTVQDGIESTKKWHEENPEYAKGGLIKRADGSYSKRGLWDNIRANAGSGKKPTPEMLKQERKIKAKYPDGGLIKNNTVKNPEWYTGRLVQNELYPLMPIEQRKIPQSGIVVDKRTNNAYYFGDKGQTGTFPVLTGKNVEGNRNTYSLNELEANAKLRATPVGYYTINKESTYKPKDVMQHYAGMVRDVEPISAYGVSAPKSKDLGFHLTYTDPKNPVVFKNRDSLYRGKEIDRNASYGCINCEKASYEAFNTAIPKTDTLMILDSKNYADKLLLEQAKNRIKTKIKD